MSKSYIDLNRTGVALMEIVSRPDMRSAEQKLRPILKNCALSACVPRGRVTAIWKKWTIAGDVNVSVRRPGKEFARTETKNLNSVRFIQQAIDYEAAFSDIELIEDGRQN